MSYQPIANNYSVLYCNRELLKKYNKKIPRTWDELMKIGKEIVEEERKLGNSNLVAYNGLFNSKQNFFYKIYNTKYLIKNIIY